MIDKTGGPAFPTPACESGYKLGADNVARAYVAIAQPGMTLRDYFAAAFMVRAQSLCETDSGWDAQTTAQCAYMMADAMLAERDKP